MLKIMKEKWAKNEALLREAIAEIPNVHDIKYDDLVKMTFEIIYNSGEDWSHTCVKCKDIVHIDHGQYCGTLMYVIPFDTYEPDANEYLMTFVGYGSCCGCDTLQGIQTIGWNYDSHKPDERQVSELMTLCRDIVMHTIKPYNHGWYHDEKFDQVEFENEE